MENKLKALIVEDVILLQRMLQKLTGEYAVSETAQNGKYALELFSKNYFNGDPFDVIFLDIFMPEMDGIEALRNIRQFENELKMNDEERVKIIMVSSMSNPSMIEKARKFGCNGYVTKPFNKDQIIKEMKRLNLIKHVMGSPF